VRILVGADVTPNLDSGAAGTVLATNEALRELGHEVDAFWGDAIRHRIRHWNLHYLLELPTEYARVVAAHMQGKRYDVCQLSQPYAWRAARDHRRAGRPGIFVNRSHGLESMADGVLAEWHERLGEKANSWPRSMLSPMLQSRLHASIDRVVEFADGMLVPCADIRDHLVRHHHADPRRVGIGYHGVPEEFLRESDAPVGENRWTRILYVGQFAFIKGPRLLARAACAVLDAEPRASMTWVCSAADHDKVAALFPAGLRERVRLLDWMPRPRLIALYDSHGIHMAHSLYESGAKTCVEGMARAQAVVSSRVGAMKEHIQDGDNGCLVDVGDTDAMAAATLRLLRDPGLAERMGVAARKSVQGLSWRKCALSSLKLYRRVAAMGSVSA
jgi:glycosyltransferase involved in cell wall biosynthesis